MPGQFVRLRKIPLPLHSVPTCCTFVFDNDLHYIYLRTCREEHPISTYCDLGISNMRLYHYATHVSQSRSQSVESGFCIGILSIYLSRSLSGAFLLVACNTTTNTFSLLVLIWSSSSHQWAIVAVKRSLIPKLNSSGSPLHSSTSSGANKTQKTLTIESKAGTWPRTRRWWYADQKHNLIIIAGYLWSGWPDHRRLISLSGWLALPKQHLSRVRRLKSTISECSDRLKIQETTIEEEMEYYSYF